MLSRLASSFSILLGPFQAVTSIAYLRLLRPLLSGCVPSLKFLPDGPGLLALQKQESFKEALFMETKLPDLTDILRFFFFLNQRGIKVSLEYLFFKMLNALTEAVDV